MLSLRCETDLDRWRREPEPQQERDLLAWLAPLRGPALSGLEDLGSAAFRGWVDQRRSVIHDQVEERLSSAHARFGRLGQPGAAELIRARAERLGLELRAHPPAPPSSELSFEWPEQERALREVMERAARTPQLALLQGHGGTRRSLLGRLVQGTPWYAVQVQCSSQALLLSALAQQLTRALPPEQRPPPTFLLAADPDAALIQVAALMTQAGVPLLIALHNVDEVPAWLRHLLLFWLDLPLPLALVLTTTSARGLAELRLALGQVSARRLHCVTLPPLGVAQVMRGLAAREAAPSPTAAPPETAQAAAGRPAASSSARRAHATRLVQLSEGLPLYVNALAQNARAQGETPGEALGARLPAAVRDLLLADLARLPSAARGGLARLAQVYGRFDPALAAALLGEAAPEVLRVGTQAGLLAAASAREQLSLPELDSRSDDAETGLTFASEITRSALAGTLPAAERHALRAALAGLLVQTDPARSLLYATRAQRPDLAAAARAALPALPAPRCLGTAAPADEPPTTAHPRREAFTPGGYRVTLECGFLHVLRRGHPGPPPLLTLTLPGAGGGGAWTLVARLDVPEQARRDGEAFPPPFALGVRCGPGPRTVYASRPLPDHHEADHHEDGAEHIFGGVLPLGQWFRLCSPRRAGRAEGGGAGAPELSVRALDAALTVGALEWEGGSLRGLCGDLRER